MEQMKIGTIMAMVITGALLLAVASVVYRPQALRVDCVTHVTIDGRAECVSWEVR